MLTLPVLLLFVALEAAAGLCVVLTIVDPGRRARYALTLLALLVIATALAILALGIGRGELTTVAPRDPRWTALDVRVLLGFAAALTLAVGLAWVGHELGSRVASVLAAALGLVALAILDAVYAGAALAAPAVAALCAAIALGGLIAALALACRARVLRGPLAPAVEPLLTLSVGALALEGFLLLGHVGLGFPGPSPRPLLHGALATWFWLRLLTGLALPLAIGLLAQRVGSAQPARLSWLLAAMVGFLTLGELTGRLLLLQTAVLF